MQSFGDVLGRLGDHNLVSELHHARRSKDWFLVSLTPQNDTLGRPSQRRDNLTGVHIQKDKTKTTIGDQLVGTEVSGRLINRAQHDT